MNKILYFLLLLFAFVPFVANGQGGCDALIKNARTLAKNLKFDEAVKKVEAAKGCAAQADIDRLYSEIFAGLKKQTIDANRAKDRAEKAEKEAVSTLQQLKTEQEKTKTALVEVEKAKNEAQEAQVKTELARLQTDSSLQKATKLINAFYFYDGKFALSYGQKGRDNIFYFIDKNGDEVPSLGQWQNAQQFDWLGFSKTQNHEWQNFLLDSTGRIFHVAYNVLGISTETRAIDFSGKKLSAIPKQVLKQDALSILLMNNCGLSSLPTKIGQLKNLTTLDLGGNKLRNLPAEIGQLKNLTSLNLSGKLPNRGNLRDLPAEIGQLKNLTYLNLYYNQLSSLPAEIGQLKNLTSVDLGGNLLSSLPPEIGQLKRLTHLNLLGNPLSSLPVEIGQLKNLTSLDLYSNKLINVPVEIGQLKNLTHLNLGGNQLSSVPTEIGQLKNLTHLRCMRSKSGGILVSFSND